MSYLLLGLLSLLATSAFAAKAPKDLHFVVGCTIYKVDGSIAKKLPGQMCLFMEDGSFITADVHKLRMYDRLGAIKWEIKGHFHHQLNFNNDKTKILTLSSVGEEKGDKKLRFDKFLVIDLAGKIVQQVSAQTIIDKFKVPTIVYPVTQEDVLKEWGYTTERTHFNSFYELPQVDKKAPAFLQEGGFVVNSLSVGAWILSSDLQTLKHHHQFKTAWKNWVHDVQILKDGTALFFNNTVAQERKDAINHLYSAIQIVDLVTGAVKFEFTPEPREFFYSPVCGGVQDLDGDVLIFSGNVGGTFAYSRKQKKVLFNIQHTHMAGNYQPVPQQQVKALDLTSFLSKSL